MQARKAVTFDNPVDSSLNAAPHSHTLYLAGGCFWGLEAYLKRLPGVQKTVVGYANGNTENPSYSDVCGGDTGHAETVAVTYDRGVLPTDMLLDAFFEAIDPTVLNRQGADVGTQYRSAIFWEDASDVPSIEAALLRQKAAHLSPIVTQVEHLDGFYPAEAYHQDYLKKNPSGYCHVNVLNADSFARRMGLAEGKTCVPYDGLCSSPESPSLENTTPSINTLPIDRTSPVDPSDTHDVRAHIRTLNYQPLPDEELQEVLTPDQYRVVRKNGTEQPFSNAYNSTFKPGIYIDITSGEPLFSSTDKFDSGCGWPAFSRPITPELLVEKHDDSHGFQRTEVRSKTANAHLGHVFNDGPQEAGGLRYCINSAALRFIPLEEMDAQGYGYLKSLVEK